ncbi:MAG: hypothetical protein WB698_01660 [Solirubrobacteraceae bacterium]
MAAPRCVPGALSACGAGASASRRHGQTINEATGSGSQAALSTTSSSRTRTAGAFTRPTPMERPRNLAPFQRRFAREEGAWRPAGRRVFGSSAVYETTLIAPGGSRPAGLAWMDTHLMSARLYSGSRSPGGDPYRYTAPIGPGIARYLVAAFNGGFMMSAAEGGYYLEGRTIDPLRTGAASLVIYKNGSVNVGAWGREVRMSAQVASVRQNLMPLISGGQATPRAASPDWLVWGATCGVSSCSGPGIESQWRSGLGITADGALVYAQGPALDPLQLARLLARAGVVRGMQLDINPDWPIFAAYSPNGERGLASVANGSRLLAGSIQSPATFFDPSWARDFITMSARHPPGATSLP